MGRTTIDMRPRQFTDDEVLEIARRIFLEQGPHVSTATIAEELGVSQAALFKRFKTKQALMIQALAPRGVPEWIGEVTDGPDDRPVRVQLLELVQRLDAFFEQMLPGIAVLSAAGIAPTCMVEQFDVPPPTMTHRVLTGWFRRLHEAGRAHVPHPQSTAMAFLGALHARHMLRHVLGEHGPKTEPGFLMNLVDMFCQGLMRRSSDPRQAPGDSA